MENSDGRHADKPIRVLVADDHPVVRSGIKDELAKHPDLLLLGEAVDGYLLKDEEPGPIAEGIRAVAAGKTWLSSAVAEIIVASTVREDRPDDLSPREEEVLSLMAKGLSNEVTAEQLSISVGTVKNHVSNLYSKLGVRTRAEAVALAWGRRKQED